MIPDKHVQEAGREERDKFNYERQIAVWATVRRIPGKQNL